MAGRVEGKIAVVVGGGQTPGETIGNGRATADEASVERVDAGRPRPAPPHPRPRAPLGGHRARLQAPGSDVDGARRGRHLTAGLQVVERHPEGLGKQLQRRAEADAPVGQAALVELGRTEDARTLLESFEARARAVERGWALAAAVA